MLRLRRGEGKIETKKEGKRVETVHWEAGPGLWVWLAGTADVAPGQWDLWYAQMDPARQARCDRYRRREDKARCVLADALARQALGAFSGADPAAITFVQDPGGKPRAAGLDVEFSLSHSGTLVLCAAAPFPVGADIQRLKSVSPALLRRAERAGYRGSSQGDFFRWWVRQEAAGKLSGQGLSLAPLPQGLRFFQGEVRDRGEDYAFSICAGEALLSHGPVI